MTIFHRVAGLAKAVVTILPSRVRVVAREAQTLLTPVAIAELLRAVITGALFALIAAPSGRARTEIFRPRVLLASLA